MKNSYMILKSAVLLFFLGTALTSCFDDKSTIDDNSIARYVIRPAVDESFSITSIALEKTVIKPVVYKILHGDTIHNVEDELNYYWTVGTILQNNDTTRLFLCDGKDLDMVVPVPPAPSTYTLTLNTIDKKYGIHTMTNWSLRMSSVYNDGLIVADTKDNGETSDLSLIMSPELSNFYGGKGEPKRFHDIFSINNNGKKLQGAVSLIQSSSINEQTQFTFISENKKTMTRVYPSDFSIMDEDQERFIIPEDYFAPCYFGNGYYENFLVNNGLINTSDWQSNASMQYGYPLEADDKGYYCRKYFAHASGTGGASDGLRFIIYDELNGRFLKLHGKFDPIKTLTKFNPNNGGAFDLNDVPNKTCEMAGTIFSGRRLFMLRDKTTNNLSMYILAKNANPDNGKVGVDIIDMSSFPDINHVIRYVISPIEETIYYATNKKIYALIMTGDLYKVEERYSAPSGTIITAMEMMDQWGVKYTYKTEIDPETGEEVDSKMPLQNEALIYATYDEASKTGTVTTQYIESIGAGTFSKEYIWKHTGFGKITALRAVSY